MNLELLSELAAGDKAKIAGFSLPGESLSRLFEMGLTRGTAVEIVRFAPLGDPVEIKVRGYNLSLRKREAAGIQVDKI
jgi:Fe2+ transport system protein FeoA